MLSYEIFILYTFDYIFQLYSCLSKLSINEIAMTTFYLLINDDLVVILTRVIR